MTTDIKTAIIDFADRMSPKVPSATVADVKDWANHTEWSLALEVLAEHLFESGNTFSTDEWTEFSRIIDLAQCEPARFEFVRPADG